jgi:hypothetical protein
LQEFLKENSLSTIARQLQHDLELCEVQKLPSLLALYLQAPRPDLANTIFAQLRPESANLPRSIKVVQYAGIVQGIKCMSKPDITQVVS